MLSPASGEVTIATKATTYTVEVTNSISRDTGSLKVKKTLTGGPGASYDPDYTISWNCNDGVGAPYDGSTTVKAGAAAVTARTGIPTGTQCTVSETLPGAPTDYSFGTPTYDPSATVTIATKDQEVTVTVQNTLTRDQGFLKIKKVFDAKTSGFSAPSRSTTTAALATRRSPSPPVARARRSVRSTPARTVS